MNPLKGSLYLADVEKSADALKEIPLPTGKTFFVTGATGLIGSALVDILVYLNKKNNLGWKIICAVHNKQKFGQRFEPYLCNPWFTSSEYDIARDNAFPEKADYIIHGAGNAFPAAFASKPVETLESGIKSLSALLRYVMAKKCRLVYISSGEVYGLINHAEPITENELGYIELLNPRSAYPMGKRACENLCASFCTEYNADCVIARPCHTYGPTASPSDNRISSAFLFDAASGKNLVMKSAGEQVRSYCYCLDCATGLLAVCFAGKAGDAYNVANKKSVLSVRELSELIASAAGVRLCFENAAIVEKKNFNPMMNACLAAAKLESLGWRPLFKKEEGIEHSVAILKECMQYAG